MPTEREIVSDSPKSRMFTPQYFKAEAVRKNARQLLVLLGKNHLFIVEIYHTFTFSSFVFSLYNSHAQPMLMARRPPKSTTEKVPGPDIVTRVRTSSGRTAEVTPIQSH